MVNPSSRPAEPSSGPGRQRPADNRGSGALATRTFPRNRGEIHTILMTMKERTCQQVRFVQAGEPVVSMSVSPTPICPVTRRRANGIRQGQDDLGSGPQGYHSLSGKDKDSEGSPHLPPSEDLERGLNCSPSPPPLWEQRKCWRGLQAALGSGYFSSAVAS